ncbi:MAG: hypothetical protein FWG54_02070 [Bacteroidetes bacterium]|nr:hypothetical protein [Bacteroidota bacterium]
MALTILISVFLLALCVLAMAISILLKKGGKFPETEIGRNPQMRKMGIRCAKEEELSCPSSCGSAQCRAHS